MAKQAKTSASDLSTRKPIGKRVPAAVSGAIGGGLAETLWNDAMHAAGVALTAIKTQKDRLKEIIGLGSVEDHTKFRETLEAHREEVRKAAEGSKLKLDEYYVSCDEGRLHASAYAAASMWQKFSKAAQAGFNPAASNATVDYDASWQDISKAATAYLKANAKRDNLTQAEKDAEEAKAKAQAVKAVTRNVEKAIEANLLTDGKAGEAYASALPDVVASMCKHATSAELTAVIEKLTAMQAEKLTAEQSALEAAGKAVAKAKQGKGSKAKAEVKNPGTTV